ncbi:hypothetical protein ACS2B2_25770 [Bacillus cereus group sp. BceL297]|uniref:hypothetical protein n=1 Tax=unclassified Bacillus cereus group TaxID=2750818 RepID=UPI003F23792B
MGNVFDKIEREIFEEGIKIGKTNTLIELIKKHLGKGKSPEQIQGFLELSKEEYLDLIKKMDSEQMKVK